VEEVGPKSCTCCRAAPASDEKREQSLRRDTSLGQLSERTRTRTSVNLLLLAAFCYHYYYYYYGSLLRAQSCSFFFRQKVLVRFVCRREAAHLHLARCASAYILQELAHSQRIAGCNADKCELQFAHSANCMKRTMCVTRTKCTTCMTRAECESCALQTVCGCGHSAHT